MYYFGFLQLDMWIARLLLTAGELNWNWIELKIGEKIGEGGFLKVGQNETKTEDVSEKCDKNRGRGQS